jgi:PHD/YefM family antitoxin component YafN of YafNO toxin-antitoxin module
MYSISQSELTPQLQKLIQQTLATHEPLKISMDHGQTAILLAEQDYHQLLGILNQIRGMVAQAEPPKIRKQRVFGSSKGLIKMADDFDAPLDDFKEYM